MACTNEWNKFWTEKLQNTFFNNIFTYKLALVYILTRKQNNFINCSDKALHLSTLRVIPQLSLNKYLEPKLWGEDECTNLLYLRHLRNVLDLQIYI